MTSNCVLYNIANKNIQLKTMFTYKWETLHLCLPQRYFVQTLMIWKVKFQRPNISFFQELYVNSCDASWDVIGFIYTSGLVIFLLHTSHRNLSHWLPETGCCFHDSFRATANAHKFSDKYSYNRWCRLLNVFDLAHSLQVSK